MRPHGCSGRRRGRPLCVPVGGGPPASRPRCELRSARRLEARPGPATAHRHRGRSLRRPPHQWGLVCWRMVRRVGSLSGQVLPPPMGTPAAPSGPSNVVCFVVLRFGDAPMRVVTNVVNRRCFSCGFLIRCYKRRQSDGFFAENQGFWTQIDDVCNMSTRKGGSNCSGLTTFVTDIAHGCCGLAQPPPTGTAAWLCRPGGPVV